MDVAASMRIMVLGVVASHALTGQTPQIKWPNDVLLGGRKIAGILLECHHRRPPGFVVAGIGLNVLQSEEDFAPELRGRAASLAMMCRGIPDIRRESVAAMMLENLAHQYARWPREFPQIEAACERMGCLSPGKTANEKGGSHQGAAS